MSEDALKKFVAILILLALAGGGLYFFRGNPLLAKTDGPSSGAAEAPKSVKAERGTIDLRVSTTGKVTSNLDVEIKSKASGQIVRLPFDISDRITSGDLLAELDPVDENRNVILREASLASARAKLAQAVQQYRMAEVLRDTSTSSAVAEAESAKIRNRDAEARLARQEDLFRKHLISSEELDAARTEAAAAANSMRQAETKLVELANLPRTVEVRKHDVQLNESSVKTSEIELETALQRLKETRIYAPMNGVLTARTVQTGQIIASGISNVSGGTALMTLSDLSRLFVNANVDESDIGKVREDQVTTITADAYPGRRFHGKVVRVSPKGATKDNVVTFEVKIEVEGEGRGLLKPEMTANVEIQADRHENVLVLPNEAVQYGKEGYFVELQAGPEKTRRQRIKPGLTDGINTEIESGVEEGQEIALPATLQSRWVQGQADARGGRQGGPNFQRGMQMATMRLSGAGRGGRH